LVNANGHLVFPENAGLASKAFESSGRRHLYPYTFMERMMLPDFVPSVKRFAYSQSGVDLCRVAIALERYHLVHGDYPESLDALSPQLIEEVPHDIVNGQPLHYRGTPDGQFVVYSIGWNEADDGGVVVFKKDAKGRSIEDIDISEGDWVWRYPDK
jgi:hypothetical protein